MYIGAERFGARAAAGNSVGDIAELCEYAHSFGAKVYVTVNTIIYDNEIEATRRLLRELDAVGVDAVLVQDMAVLSLLPAGCRMAVHASTQTDNRSADKTVWLARQGFSRVVLARELSLAEIRTIHEASPETELEAFVHGALCVSYSGLCYASQCCFRRSANRGECAQFCRLAFCLEDADGNTIDSDRYLLSLKDMCRLDALEKLAEVGVTSFKIEGRLKDAAYVKNVTAAYNYKLNEIVSRNPSRYRRSSIGRCDYFFKPNLKKTFNRGFTEYMLDGSKDGIASPETPKAMGEYVGRVKEIRRQSFNVAGTAAFANGDGLCFINGNRCLEGFRVNRVEGNRLFPLRMPQTLRPGTPLYRNNDVEFERLLAKRSAERKVAIAMTLQATANGFRLTAVVKGGLCATSEVVADHQQALRPQQENIKRQLTKLGNTIYTCNDADVRLIGEDGSDRFDFFIPTSSLATLRRIVTERLSQAYQTDRREPLRLNIADRTSPPAYHAFSYQYNVANSVAREFYERHGLLNAADAYEKKPVKGALLMQCRHCLRLAYGFCPKRGGTKATWREPLTLSLPDGRRFRLDFDCRHCQMNVYEDVNN